MSQIGERKDRPATEKVGHVCSTCGRRLSEEQVKMPVAGPFPVAPVPATDAGVCPECGGSLASAEAAMEETPASQRREK